jgi:membrane-bound ClpP family serine protease
MNNIKQIARDYNINPKALKRFVKELGLKPKQALRLQVLEVLLFNSSDLFYCRADGFAIEYLDFSLVMKLIKEIEDIKKGML